MEWLARGDTLRRRGMPEPLWNEGGPWSLRVTPAKCLLTSPILREPPRCCRPGGGVGEEVGVTVALRVCLGEGVFRPLISTCLKQIHSPFTLPCEKHVHVRLTGFNIMVHYTCMYITPTQIPTPAFIADMYTVYTGSIIHMKRIANSL